jgi:hypothetical protein
MHSYAPAGIASYSIGFRLGTRRFKRADVIASVTYVIDGAVIVLALLVYFGALPVPNVNG